jgi:DNA-binding response OmpR family regulator
MDNVNLNLLPPTLALVDNDAAGRELLSQSLRALGVEVHCFGRAQDLLADDLAFAFDFYILEQMLAGEDGLALLHQLRQRSDAGVLVLTGRLAPQAFEQAIGGGADMLLSKPVTAQQVQLAVASIHRRAAPANVLRALWRLDRSARRLIAPDGVAIDLSPTDVTVLECLVNSQGAAVSRETLAQSLGWSQLDDPNLLHATIYRLRRRIERATSALVPLQSKSRLGYVFRAPLVAR